jgi:ATP-dependent RNA helicase SUPV3L1/SUV3
VLPAPAEAERARLARLGFRAAGPQMIRVDMAERLARHAHEVKAGKEGEVVDEALVTSLGLQPQALARLMRDIGFRLDDGETRWVWRGRGRRRAPADRGSAAFAALAELRGQPRG